MKKGILIFSLIFICLILASSIYAQEQLANQAQNDSNKSVDIKNKANEVTTKINNVLEKEIIVPDSLQGFARVLFGLKPEHKIDFSTLIILIAIWAGFVTLMSYLFSLMPFMNKGVPKFLGAIVVTCLVAISGGLLAMASFFLDIGRLINFFERLWAPLKFLSLVFSIIIAAVIVFLFSYVVRILKDKAEIEEAEAVGMKVGMGQRLIKEFLKIFGAHKK